MVGLCVVLLSPPPPTHTTTTTTTTTPQTHTNPPDCAAGPARHLLPVSHGGHLGAVQVLHHLADHVGRDIPRHSAQRRLADAAARGRRAAQQALAALAGSARRQQAAQQPHRAAALRGLKRAARPELVAQAVHQQCLHGLLDVCGQAGRQRRAAHGLQPRQALLQHAAALGHLLLRQQVPRDVAVRHDQGQHQVAAVRRADLLVLQHPLSQLVHCQVLVELHAAWRGSREAAGGAASSSAQAHRGCHAAASSPGVAALTPHVRPHLCQQRECAGQQADGQVDGPVWLHLALVVQRHVLDVAQHLGPALHHGVAVALHQGHAAQRVVRFGDVAQQEGLAAVQVQQLRVFGAAAGVRWVRRKGGGVACMQGWPCGCGGRVRQHTAHGQHARCTPSCPTPHLCAVVRQPLHLVGQGRWPLLVPCGHVPGRCRGPDCSHVPGAACTRAASGRGRTQGTSAQQHRGGWLLQKRTRACCALGKLLMTCCSCCVTPGGAAEAGGLRQGTQEATPLCATAGSGGFAAAGSHSWC
jgi:hypothetical protein